MTTLCLKILIWNEKEIEGKLESWGMNVSQSKYAEVFETNQLQEAPA